MTEYEELQKLRALWSKAIVTRDYIFIPLIMGIIAVSLSQLPNFPAEWRIYFLAFEGMLLTFSVLYWRFLSIKTDEGIVGLYGRMLELEKEQQMDIQTKYFYSYLKSDYREKINKKVGLESENKNFSKFKKAAELKAKDLHYTLLIEIWDKYENESVTSRGHEIHNWAAIGLFTAYWIFFIAILMYFKQNLESG